MINELTETQIAALRPPTPTGDTTVDLDDADQRMLDALGEDGRAGYGALATVTGWSESTVTAIQGLETAPPSGRSKGEEP